MLTDRHSAGGREDRERIEGARQAAEDLFKPKRDVEPVAGATSAPPASVEQHSPRSPRIILIQPVTRTSIAVEAEPPAKPTPEAQSAIVQKRMFQIPESHFGRIRALTSYGKTPGQVSELYKIPIDEVEEIISQGSRRKL